MQVKLELTKKELKDLIIAHFREKLGPLEFKEELLCIETKSKQNWKSEWEEADFRAVYEGKSY